MKKVLVLGAGLVSRPLVRYLLEQPDFSVTVATRTVSKAEALVAGHPRGAATALLSEDTARLEKLIADHDLAVSLLPAPQHPTVAKLCIQHRKHMVTTSYVSPQMRALDEAARTAGVILLNEIGVDPGIDHMSAMRIIHTVQKRGGRVASFKSYCGGLPAPEANNNPWGYKFSWSPRAVCTAGKNAARFREDGKLVEIPGPELFTSHHPLRVEGVGELEAYPNRDSLSYIDLYGLEGIETMFPGQKRGQEPFLKPANPDSGRKPRTKKVPDPFSDPFSPETVFRGTLRYPGWCGCLKAVVDLGMLDETPVTYPAGMMFAQWTAGLIKARSPDAVREQVAKFLQMEPHADPLDRLAWLGLFSNQSLPITSRPTTALDILAARMNEKMPYQPGERDMIVLVHRFVARFPGRPDEHIRSELIDFGQPDGDTAMARTVSLPAAIGAKLILTGGIRDAGVHIPVTPPIYNPVLDELATMNIRCVEETVPAEA